jgi:hypothetical protein
MKLGMYTIAPDPISAAYFTNSLLSVCVYAYVAMQRLDENVGAATNTHGTIEEFGGA